PARVQVPSEASAAGAAPGAGATASAGPARPVNNSPPPGDPPPPSNTPPPPHAPPLPATTRPAYANDRNGTAKTDPVYDQPGNVFSGGVSAIVPSSLSDTFGLDRLFGGKKTDPAG